MKRFRLRSPRATENDIEAGCLALLRLRGWYPIRLPSGLFKTPDGRWMRIGEPGLPDYAALHEQHPGILLEVKRPGGKLALDQIEFIDEVRMGYRLAVGVVDSTESLAAFLDNQERVNKPQ